MNLLLDFTLRIFVAGAMGIFIGLEREYRAKEAGYRTHFLVALGSSLMMIVSQYGFENVLAADLVRLDPSRIAAQVVSGIGFIGAGTIILQKQVVRGLTTAAGIWATAGIGLAIGAGMYAIGCIATCFVLLGLEVLSFFFKSLTLKNMILEFSTSDKEAIKNITSVFEDQGYIIITYEMTDMGISPSAFRYHVCMTLKTKRIDEKGLLSMLMKDFPQVTVSKVI